MWAWLGQAATGQLRCHAPVPYLFGFGVVSISLRRIGICCLIKNENVSKIFGRKKLQILSFVSSVLLLAFPQKIGSRTFGTMWAWSGRVAIGQFRCLTEF
ncbi:hypothetical protein Y032_0030g2132 [Ancylostoma ceylanicum]|uniref:Uncharacterized protein n=1 Tax=Ancylostoma ceylanicum TaxID=53326 RepID=A0A016UQX4_9BILA|nr:hypothetical protein Y032_0030g2132 [Ancylostoma ceylanicum]